MSESYSASYAAAGVDITAGYRAVELMKSHVARTMTAGVCGDIGGGGGLPPPRPFGRGPPARGPRPPRGGTPPRRPPPVLPPPAWRRPPSPPRPSLPPPRRCGAGFSPSLQSIRAAHDGSGASMCPSRTPARTV